MRIEDCAALLRENDGYYILTHVGPDGDTICSAAALCSALRRCGKSAFLFPNPGITESYFDLAEPYFGTMPENAFIITVDVAARRMLPDGVPADTAVALCIDHHGGNDGFGAYNLVMGRKASCGEIIMEVIDALCGGISAEEANLLYVAVSTDCGCFCYGNTTPETLRAGARLVELGAKNGELNKRFFRSFSFARLKLEGMIYSSLRSYRDNKINIAVITREMLERSGATEDDCSDLASLAGRVRGSVVNVTVRELPDGGSKVSLRTNEQVDASAVCARFGGGGHAMASGCNLDCGPEEAADRMLSAVNDIWK